MKKIIIAAYKFLKNSIEVEVMEKTNTLSFCIYKKAINNIYLTESDIKNFIKQTKNEIQKLISASINEVIVMLSEDSKWNINSKLLTLNNDNFNISNLKNIRSNFNNIGQKILEFKLVKKTNIKQIYSLKTISNANSLRLQEIFSSNDLKIAKIFCLDSLKTNSVLFKNSKQKVAIFVDVLDDKAKFILNINKSNIVSQVLDLGLNKLKARMLQCNLLSTESNWFSEVVNCLTYKCNFAPIIKNILGEFINKLLTSVATFVNNYGIDLKVCKLYFNNELKLFDNILIQNEKINLFSDFEYEIKNEYLSCEMLAIDNILECQIKQNALNNEISRELFTIEVYSNSKKYYNLMLNDIN